MYYVSRYVRDRFAANIAFDVGRIFPGACSWSTFCSSSWTSGLRNVLAVQLAWFWMVPQGHRSLSSNPALKRDAAKCAAPLSFTLDFEDSHEP